MPKTDNLKNPPRQLYCGRSHAHDMISLIGRSLFHKFSPQRINSKKPGFLTFLGL
ncbi:hypothetical protein [Microcoleus sp. AR_TQ3_B6]|uniref:hypothetical protein n=1 Tax=Microcoleus sp. AR_TQ3_B6 TaxID=3055284 RepID=UPI002FD35DD2